MTDYSYKIEMSVRDYELDMQGIVNNSVYQQYLEHARHEFLLSIGVNFKAYADMGINLVVIRAELDYKQPLTSGDRFWVGVRLERESAARFAFYQDIFRCKDDRLMLRGKVIGTALNERGRPRIPEELAALLQGKNLRHE
ncbi:MAG: acyl-CoA thioesterase [Geobacteraceae bacterium]|nr:acyl-CoA thioesterase [Geobacteraceae bacterium]